MYYFDILEIFEKNAGKSFSKLDIIAELKKGQEVNEVNVRKMLTKLYLSDKISRRKKKMYYNGNGGVIYIYWLKR